MKTFTLLFPLCLVLTVAANAQDGTKKTDPAAAPKVADKAAPLERPKDDAMTAKDPAILAIDKFIAGEFPGNKPDRWRTQLKQPPKLTFSKDAQYEWRLKTNKGDISIRLLPDIAPMHVSSTIYLARLGFYDGLKFHRVITGFMAQAVTRWATAPADRVTSTRANSTPRSSTTNPDASPWPTPDRERTARNSS